MKLLHQIDQSETDRTDSTQDVLRKSCASGGNDEWKRDFMVGWSPPHRPDEGKTLARAHRTAWRGRGILGQSFFEKLYAS